MANNVIKRIWNQNKMVNIEALDGMAFQAEDGGHTFEISGVDGQGNPVALSGTVAGVFRRPDNADIALVGTASDGKVSVTLTDACYAVTGKFGLTIFVTADSKKTAVYAAIGTVAGTTGGAVAGDTPQDVVDLVNAINAAVATIPASYANLMASIAPTYSNSALYAVGSYVWYDGNLYRCITSITTAESWTAAHWTQVTLGGETSFLYESLRSSLNPVNLFNKSNTFEYNNNTAVTNNGDGSYTVGTSDYGRTVFSRIVLDPGVYIMSGSDVGGIYISTDGGLSSTFASNYTPYPQLFVISEQKSGYVGLRIPSPPSSQFTVSPCIFGLKSNAALKYMGPAPVDISTITEPGFYTKVDASIHSGLPSGYSGTTGFLLALPNLYGREWALEFLVNSNSKPTIWYRLYKTDGTYNQEWQILTTDAVYDSVKTNLNKLSSVSVSLSGNYFDWKNAEWLVGFDNGHEIVSNNAYRYAFARLYGPGNYIRVMYYSAFGSTGETVSLYDKNKNRIKNITATRIGETNGFSFTLSEEDALTAEYTTVNWYTSNIYHYSGLYYNSSAYPLLAGYDCPLPNFKGASNGLYKKVLIADGDSIGQALLDKPFYRKGWWGRLVTDYSCTGQNYSVGGGTITSELYYENSNPRHWINESIDTIYSTYSTLDYLILDGGTNDADLIGRFSGDTPPAKFGTWTETDFSGSYDNTTFCGAVETMFYKALTHWPKAKIGFIIPMEMGTNNLSVANRRRYFDEIKKIAVKWHIPVLDLWNECQMDARLSVYYDSTMTEEQNVSAEKCYNDGQHPTSYGYDLMQGKIDAWVNSL